MFLWTFSDKLVIIIIDIYNMKGDFKYVKSISCLLEWYRKYRNYGRKIAEGLENAGVEVDVRNVVDVDPSEVLILIKSHLVVHQWLMKN